MIETDKLKEFGDNLHNVVIDAQKILDYCLLFENIEPEDIGIIAADIERQLRKYDNRVRFDEVIIDQTDFLLEIELKYFVLLGSRNEPVLQVVKLTLTRIR